MNSLNGPDNVSGSTPPLLATDEALAFEIVNPRGRSPVVLICDHAAHRIPRVLGSLGLDPAALREHIAWDPGAADVARGLSARLDAPLVLSAYSRLVIDCNRPPDHPTSITAIADGIPVPGNQALSAAQRACRVHALFEPYHRAVDDLLDQRGKRLTLLVSVHSFTPVLNGVPRRWDIGISHARDRRLADRMLAALKAQADIVVGNDEPYPIEGHYDYSIPAHGDARGVPSVMIEIRQDGIRNATQADAWAARLAYAITPIASTWRRT